MSHDAKKKEQRTNLIAEYDVIGNERVRRFLKHTGMLAVVNVDHRLLLLVSVKDIRSAHVRR